jgi:hypothetical protein
MHLDLEDQYDEEQDDIDENMSQEEQLINSRASFPKS